MTTHAPVHSTPDHGCSHPWCRAPHATDGHAARAVELARMRVDTVRRRFMRRQAGAADVHQAEAELSDALDRLAEHGGP